MLGLEPQIKVNLRSVKLQSWTFSFIDICDLILDYPNQCYIASLKEAFAVGKHKPKGKCMEVLCRENFFYEIQTYVPLNTPLKDALNELYIKIFLVAVQFQLMHQAITTSQILTRIIQASIKFTNSTGV